MISYRFLADYNLLTLINFWPDGYKLIKNQEEKH